MTAPDTARAPAAPRWQVALFWLTFAAGLGRALWLMWHSPGSPLDDEIAHFLIAQGVWDDPRLLLNLWGRSVNTLVFAVPAAFGLTAARGLALLMTGIAILLTARLAQRFGLRHAWLVPVLFWFQPWVQQLGFTCLTEVPFLLFVVAGLLAFTSGRLLAAGVLLGCLPLIRHEGIGLVAAWIAYAALTRQWRLAGALAAPYATFVALYAAVFQATPLQIFSAGTHTDHYGAGGWLHFAPHLVQAAGLALLPALYGLPRLLRTRESALATGTFVLYLAIHVVVYRFGLFASGGYVEFLLPLAALVALAGAAGVEALAEELHRHSRPELFGLRFGSAPVLATGIAVLAAGIVVQGLRHAAPHALQPIDVACGQAADWLRGQGLSRRAVVATHVRVHHALSLPIPDVLHLWVRPAPPAGQAAGTLVVWDGKYSDGWGLPLAELQGERWRLLAEFGAEREVRVFEKL